MCLASIAVATMRVLARQNDSINRSRCGFSLTPPTHVFDPTVKCAGTHWSSFAKAMVYCMLWSMSATTWTLSCLSNIPPVRGPLTESNVLHFQLYLYSLQTKVWRNLQRVNPNLSSMYNHAAANITTKRKKKKRATKLQIGEYVSKPKKNTRRPMDRRSNCGCALEIIASFQRLNESFNGCHLDVNTKECQNGCSATVWNILQISGCQYCAENTILQIVTKPPSVKKSLCVCQRKRKEHVKLNNKCHNKPVNFSLCQKLVNSITVHKLGSSTIFCIVFCLELLAFNKSPFRTPLSRKFCGQQSSWTSDHQIMAIFATNTLTEKHTDYPCDWWKKDFSSMMCVSPRNPPIRIALCGFSGFCLSRAGRATVLCSFNDIDFLIETQTT